MNEWLPGGNYSSPGTPNYTGRSLRSQRDESEKGTKLVNAPTLSENRSRNFQEHSVDDFPKMSLNSSNKKGGGNGISDPRFKRLINSGKQITACVGTDTKNSKPVIVPEGKECLVSKFSVWNDTEFKGNKSWIDSVKSLEQSKSKAKDSWEPDSENLVNEDDSNFDQSHNDLKVVDKLSFNHDILAKSLSKESMSEWTAGKKLEFEKSMSRPQVISSKHSVATRITINTRNMSLVSEEFGDEFSNKLARVPSASRVKKVQNWIHDQTPKPEKKHSHITVIGQMQEPDTLSSALQEIDKRRKLVKELDKYAVCKKIIKSGTEREISDLMIKINSLNNNNGAISSGSNETLNACSYNTKVCEEKSIQNFAETNNGKFRMLVNTLLHRRIFCIVIILSGLLCWCAFVLLQNEICLTFEWFNSKPKPITWHERLCKWLWELFRPFNNYQRTKPWRSY